MHLVKEHDNYATASQPFILYPLNQCVFFQSVWDLSPHYYYSGAEGGDGGRGRCL